MQAAVISEQGTRPDMEDAHHLDTDFGGNAWMFGGVYDGHGGKFAAAYTFENLHRIILEYLLKGLSPQAAFAASYEQISGDLRHQSSGTTAVTFFIKDGVIYAANAGDARAIVVTRTGVTQLTTDHRLDDTVERQRIEKMGGGIDYPYVTRGGRGLMPTRTIGDEYFKPVGVIATPSVNEYKILPGDLSLIAACDGLFDFMSNQEVAAITRRIPEPDKLVEALKHEVLDNRLGSDNLTIIAVRL